MPWSNFSLLFSSSPSPVLRCRHQTLPSSSSLGGWLHLLAFLLACGAVGGRGGGGWAWSGPVCVLWRVSEVSPCTHACKQDPPPPPPPRASPQTSISLEKRRRRRPLSNLHRPPTIQSERGRERERESRVGRGPDWFVRPLSSPNLSLASFTVLSWIWHRGCGVGGELGFARPLALPTNHGLLQLGHGARKIPHNILGPSFYIVVKI